MTPMYRDAELAACVLMPAYLLMSFMQVLAGREGRTDSVDPSRILQKSSQLMITHNCCSLP